MRDTKIAATLAPSTSGKVLRDMIRAGVNVVRINFHTAPRRDIDRVNIVQNRRRRAHIGVLADLQGKNPYIQIRRQKRVLANGSTFTFDKQANVPGDASRVGLDFPDLIKDIERGDILLLDDGKIRMRVETNNGDALQMCRGTGRHAPTAKASTNSAAACPLQH